MKVLIVHNEYKQYGGEDTVVQQEFKAYKELGYEVELYLEKNIDLNVVDLFFSIYNPITAMRFKRKVKDFKPDIVHIHNLIFKLSPAILWGIPKGVKTFMTIHNYRLLCPSGTLFFKGSINTDSRTFLGLCKNIMGGVYRDSIIKTFIAAMIYRLNFSFKSFDRIDKYIFLTKFAQNLHSDWNPKRFQKSIVKPNFLIQSVYKNSTIKIIDIIFVGRFTLEKGIMDVLPSLIKINTLRIHLVGNGPEFHNVEHQIRKHKHITLHGAKSREEVFNLLDRSKYLLFPSIWFEGMPVTIIEAYAKSIPVIARNIGAMKSMIKDRVSGFHYSTTVELEGLLQNLKNHNYSKLSKGANLEFLNNYDKVQGLKNLMKLVNENIS